MPLRISFAHNNTEEKRYILRFLLEDFLGLEVTFTDEPSEHYRIELPNGRMLEMEDVFFSSYPESHSYLKSRVPHSSSTWDSDFGKVEVIYGDATLDRSTSHIRVGLDIPASAFFMLSRWEEYALGDRDPYDRFPDSASLAVRSEFAHRPVVNEYLAFLKDALYTLDSSLSFKERKAQKIWTTDVEYSRKYSSKVSILKSMLGDLLKRGSAGAFKRTLRDWKSHGRAGFTDPYMMLDELKTWKKHAEVRAYIIPSRSGENDARYDVGDLRREIDWMRQNGILVGMHGGMDSWNDPSQFKEEFGRLKQLVPELKFNRQHYLRFSNPGTWVIHHESGISEDSTLGYTTRDGFRCGICQDYPVFNVLQRKKLDVRELPITIMDVNVLRDNPAPAEYANRLEWLSDQVAKYNGKLVVLWHLMNLAKWEFRMYNPEIQSLLERPLHSQVIEDK